ncbi:hypothetical protein VTI74DRAFT_6443 [Chaetomium olivicolor]
MYIIGLSVLVLFFFPISLDPFWEFAAWARLAAWAHSRERSTSILGFPLWRRHACCFVMYLIPCRQSRGGAGRQANGVFLVYLRRYWHASELGCLVMAMMMMMMMMATLVSSCSGYSGHHVPLKFSFGESRDVDMSLFDRLLALRGRRTSL